MIELMGEVKIPLPHLCTCAEYMGVSNKTFMYIGNDTLYFVWLSVSPERKAFSQCQIQKPYWCSHLEDRLYQSINRTQLNMLNLWGMWSYRLLAQLWVYVVREYFDLGQSHWLLLLSSPSHSCTEKVKILNVVRSFKSIKELNDLLNSSKLDFNIF